MDYWFSTQNLSNFVSLPTSKMIWIFLKKSSLKNFFKGAHFFYVDNLWQLQFLKPFIFWNIGQFLMTCQHVSAQNKIISLWSINFYLKIILILYSSLGNSTTNITISLSSQPFKVTKEKNRFANSSIISLPPRATQQIECGIK